MKVTKSKFSCNTDTQSLHRTKNCYVFPTHQCGTDNKRMTEITMTTLLPFLTATQAGHTLSTVSHTHHQSHRQVIHCQQSHPPTVTKVGHTLSTVSHTHTTSHTGRSHTVNSESHHPTVIQADHTLSTVSHTYQQSYR